jgi:polysaccharide biosynthesis protein PslF
MPNRPPKRSKPQPSGRRIGMLSTYPPKLCGLATFAAALTSELSRVGDTVTVVAIDDGDDPSHIATASELVNGSAASVREVARLLSRSDVAVIQHEYGIFGGADGDEILEVLKRLSVPAIVVLHTVPAAPTAHQRFVLERVCDLAARSVVMTSSARSRLERGYTVDTAKIVTIPHGASPPTPPRLISDARDVVRPQLLTWGLLGPGKGIEHVIRALGILAGEGLAVRYTIAGATHPKVFERDGDAYRRMLGDVAAEAGVSAQVTFDDAYRGVADLMRFVALASLVVLPYDSRDQVTSGVLVDAIAAGRPVIATAFPHAAELLSDGAGIVVPHGDPVELARAIRKAVDDRVFLESMSSRARAIAPSLTWRAVAGRYRRLCDELSPMIAPALAT